MNPETGRVPALEILRWSLLTLLLVACLVGYFRYARTATPVIPIVPTEGR
jgi:hypothetical protein